jgi:hypothetical protein
LSARCFCTLLLVCTLLLELLHLLLELLPILSLLLLKLLGG